ncbi:hypothetical protein OIV83_001893 [Microbotryomycetes sp. JL201]|nr:hypothetical protein OIV83_001893 [Microbotryomycetes sp. JL201]
MDATHNNHPHQQMVRLHKRQRERTTTTTTRAARTTAATRTTGRARQETTRRQRPDRTTERETRRQTTATASQRETSTNRSSIVETDTQTATQRAPTATVAATATRAYSGSASVRAAASTSAARSSSTRAVSPSAAAGAASSSTKNSGIGGGAIAGIVIAVIAGLAVLGGLFWWRKKKSARAGRGSGSTLVGSGGGFKKYRDDDNGSELFGNSLASGGAFGEKSPESADSYGYYNGTSPAQQSWNQQQLSYDAPSYQSQTPHTPPTIPAQAFQSSMKALPSNTVTASALAGLSQVGDDRRHQEMEQREVLQHLQQQQQEQQQQQQQLQLDGASGPFSEFPGQGAIHVVKRTFEPGLEDELVLFPGNRVQLLIRYDDGWALGINLDSNQSPPAKGVFPFDCLGEALGSSSQQPLSTILEQDSRPGSLASPPPKLDTSAVANAPTAQLGYLSNGPVPPQLPQMRSDSPIDLESPPTSAVKSDSRSTPSPTLVMPSIQISDQATGVSQELFTPPPQQMAFDDYQHQQQRLPDALQAGKSGKSTVNDKKGRRTSSLVASKDADLFLALGEVLGRDDVKQ